MKDMGLIMESWRGFLNEEVEDRGSPSHTKYSDRIDRLVGVTEKAVLHLNEFLEHLESLYDQANLNKGRRGGYTYLGLGRTRPDTLKLSKEYNSTVKAVETSITKYIKAIRILFNHLKSGTTKNLFADKIKSLSDLIKTPKKNIFHGILVSGDYLLVDSARLAYGDVTFIDRKQMVEERIAAIEKFADDVLMDYIRSHNLFADWAKTQGGGAVSREVAYKFPIDIAPQLECADKIAYFEEILKSYEDNPNIIGRAEDLIREEIDFEKMIDDPSPYEKCANKMGIEKTAQQSTDAEMADFDLDEE